MFRLLKLGDAHYSQSLKTAAPSNLEGFPQREQSLLARMREVEVSSFKHEVLSDLEVVSTERQRLSAYLKAHQVDLLMVDNPLSALTIDRSIQVPILFDCIDWYDEVYLKEFGVNKRYYLLRYGLLDLLERASKVVAQSPVILEALKIWGLKTSAATIVPNGYDAGLFYPYEAARVETLKQDLGKRLGVSLQGKQIVVYSGRLSPWYDAIKIIAEAISEQQVFLVVGDGPLAKDLPAKPNLIKVGAVAAAEVPNFTNVADVLVYPVDNDCSPIVVSEYLALGKPIVMPKGRIEWLLKDGESGYLVDNTVYAWRRGIRRALEERERFAKRNLELAAELSWDKLAQKFSDFVRGK